MWRDVERNVYEYYRYKVRVFRGMNDCVVVGDVFLIKGELF